MVFGPVIRSWTVPQDLCDGGDKAWTLDVLHRVIDSEKEAAYSEYFILLGFMIPATNRL